MAHADHRIQRAGGGDAPAPGHRRRRGVAQTGQSEQRDRVWESARPVARLGIVEGGKGAGVVPGLVLADAGDQHAVDDGGGCGLGHRGQAVGTGELDHGGAQGRQAVGRRSHHDGADRAARQQVAHRGDPAFGEAVAVDHRQQRRPFGPRPGGGERVDGETPDGAQAGGVGQPLGPVPHGRCRLVGEHGDGHVGRTVVHRGLAHQAAQQGDHHRAGADQADGAPGGDVYLHRRAADDGGGQRGGDLGGTGTVSLRQRRLPGDVGHTEAEAQDVGGAGPSLPQPDARAVGPAQRLGRIGNDGGQAPRFGGTRRLQISAEGGQSSGQGRRRAAALAGHPAPVLPPRADRHHRAEQGEGGHDRREHHRHHQADHEGRDKHGPAEACAGRRLRRRRGHGDGPGAGGRHAPGWPVERRRARARTCRA